VIAILSCGLDIGLFLFFHLNGFSVYESSAYARFIAAPFNFFMNKIWVFKKALYTDILSEIFRYVIVAIIALFLSATILDIINESYSILLASYKFAIDATIFLIGFLLQRFWVFRSNF
tara:strand:+ start:213 stop:566 length:354 start_codon:yes stop_codon:yes gene_type:complete